MCFAGHRFLVTLLSKLTWLSDLYVRGSAVAQAVRCWLLATEARVHSQGSPCWIYGGQSGTGTGFSLSFSVFPHQYDSTDAPHSLLCHLGDRQCVHSQLQFHRDAVWPHHNNKSKACPTKLFSVGKEMILFNSEHNKFVVHTRWDPTWVQSETQITLALEALPYRKLQKWTQCSDPVPQVFDLLVLQYTLQCIFFKLKRHAIHLADTVETFSGPTHFTSRAAHCNNIGHCPLPEVYEWVFDSLTCTVYQKSLLYTGEYHYTHKYFINYVFDLKRFECWPYMLVLVVYERVISCDSDFVFYLL
jgi:hypothetical protein